MIGATSNESSPVQPDARACSRRAAIAQAARGLSAVMVLPVIAGRLHAAGRRDDGLAKGGSQSHSTPLRYPDIVDTSHADPATAALLKSFFMMKSAKNVEGTMAHFSPGLLAYADATTRWYSPDFASMKSAFARIMPNWGEGLSYPTRIIGGPKSCLVEFTDTPELFGDDIRILAAVDFQDGLIVRWIDYWDSTSWSSTGFSKIKNPPSKFPASLRDGDLRVNASDRVSGIARGLHGYFSADNSAGAATFMSYDVILEDMALRARIVGRPAVEKYLARTLAIAPAGKASRLRHVVGGDLGGGYEWIGGPTGQDTLGITALELDARGKITRLTTVYDGRTVKPSARALAAMTLG